MDADFALKAVGVLLTLVIALIGIGKAWGTLMGEIRAVHASQSESDRKLDAFHRRFGELEEALTNTRLSYAELSGRVDTWERLSGLPPMYRRTQPLRPIAGDQDMFPEGDKG